jgi:hypothetical protein
MKKAKTYLFIAFVLALALLSQVSGPVLAAARPGDVGLTAPDEADQDDLAGCRSEHLFCKNAPLLPIIGPTTCQRM